MTQLNQQDLSVMSSRYRAQMVNSLSGFKSANLIGTADGNGLSNLAIFNSVIHVGANPPYLGFISRPLSVDRHTYANIKSTGFFTINQVHESFVENAHKTSARFPQSVSEFKACGFTESYVEEFKAPFVRESKVQIGLSFQEEQLISVNDTVLIIGRIEKIIIDDAALNDQGDIDFEFLKTTL